MLKQKHHYYHFLGITKPRRKLKTTLAGFMLLSAAILGIYGAFTVQGQQKQVQTPVVQVKDPAKAYKFGISLGNRLMRISDNERAMWLDDIASLGVGWVRFDIDWRDIQPTNATDFNWQQTDKIVAAANARNIKLLPVLAYTPEWARAPECKNSHKCRPVQVNDFARFTQAAVQRYAPQRIYTWEIWNEPNSHHFWQPAPNAAQYAELLKVTYPAIKSQDPAALVISGGLARTDHGSTSIAPVEYISQLYAAGAKPYFDAVGYHPYSYPVPPTQQELRNAWAMMAQTAPSLRSIMQGQGDAHKYIWVTEFGAPTSGPGIAASEDDLTAVALTQADHVNEALQAKILTEALYELQKLDWAGPLFWYSYKDLSVSKNSKENFFGLRRADGSTKPAYEAFRQTIESK